MLRPVPLAELVADESLTVRIGAIDDRPIEAVVLDSRLASPGRLWVALPGSRTHGALHATEPLAAPVAAVLTDAEGAELLGTAKTSRNQPPKSHWAQLKERRSEKELERLLDSRLALLRTGKLHSGPSHR